jgi:hypothetical protein
MRLEQAGFREFMGGDIKNVIGNAFPFYVRTGEGAALRRRVMLGRDFIKLERVWPTLDATDFTMEKVANCVYPRKFGGGRL